MKMKVYVREKQNIVKFGGKDQKLGEESVNFVLKGCLIQNTERSTTEN